MIFILRQSLTFCCAIFLGTMLFSEENNLDYKPLREQVLALGQLSTIPRIYPVENYKSEGILQPIFYDGLKYKGKSTRVFAWLGVPETNLTKIPAMVLVHGGGGTAFKEWVMEWNKRGYAAISIAVEGQTDQKETLTNGKTKWQSHNWAGPARMGIYQDDSKPLSEQWMYHAVADVVLANTLLRQNPKIDSNHIGLMGISWGGIITSAVIGIDQRFALAIPTYGCGALHKIDNHYAEALQHQRMYQEVWDPMLRMTLAKMPTLWLSWTGDAHFSIDIQSENYKAAVGKRMVSYIPNMKHGHQAGWKPDDSYAFADSIVKNGHPWAEQVKINHNSPQIEVEFKVFKSIERATLISTCDLGHTVKRKWTETPISFTQAEEQLQVKTSLPMGTTAWFINLYTGSLTLSSDLMTTP